MYDNRFHLWRCSAKRFTAAMLVVVFAGFGAHADDLGNFVEICYSSGEGKFNVKIWTGKGLAERPLPADFMREERDPYARTYHWWLSNISEMVADGWRPMLTNKDRGGPRCYAMFRE